MDGCSQNRGGHFNQGRRKESLQDGWNNPTIRSEEGSLRWSRGLRVTVQICKGPDKADATVEPSALYFVSCWSYV